MNLPAEVDVTPPAATREIDAIQLSSMLLTSTLLSLFLAMILTSFPSALPLSHLLTKEYSEEKLLSDEQWTMSLSTSQ